MTEDGVLEDVVRQFAHIFGQAVTSVVLVVVCTDDVKSAKNICNEIKRRLMHQSRPSSLWTGE